MTSITLKEFSTMIVSNFFYNSGHREGYTLTLR
jgi:hypothetical protein